ASFVALARATLPHGMLGVMVAATFAATMGAADSAINWIPAVVARGVCVAAAKRINGREPADRSQLIVGRVAVAAMGVLAIWIAFNMERCGGAFDTYLRASSLYAAPLYIPMMLGLVYKRTPWWSGMASFGGGVVAVFLVSVVANLSQGMPADSFGALFQDIRVNILGLEMTRYELNSLAGIVASGLVFFVSSLWYERSTRHRPALLALVRDLATPAYASEEVEIDVRGFRAYRIAGLLAIALALMLAVMALPAIGGDGAAVNLVGAVLSAGVGTLLVVMSNRQL